MNIVENSHIHQLDQEAAVWMFTETYGGHYHPLTWLTIALTYHFSGQNPTAYIATNIVMHGLVTALLFLLIHQLLSPLFHDRFEGRRLFIFAAATLFWALHPLRVEAVIWITERRNVLAGIFVLLALLAYTKFTRAQKRRWLWYGVCLMATGLSLLSKAWAITLPIILLLIDLYPLKRRLQLSLLLEKIPFFLLSLAFGLSAFTAQSTEALATFASHGIADRIGQIFYSLGFLPAKTVLPTGLSPLYLLKPEFSLTSPWVMPAIATVTLITGIALYLALIRKHNGPLVAWLSAIIVMLPVAGIAHSGSQITADRYTYLAAIPFSFLLAGALQQLSKHYGHRYIVIPTSLILLLLAAASLQQTSAWKNAYSLWSHAISQDSTNYVAYYNRGTTGRAEHDQAGRYADLTRAIELNPNYAGAYNNRGRLLLQNNKPHQHTKTFATPSAPTQA
jgi:tetratricopeptide (TPR) repeat protein